MTTPIRKRFGRFAAASLLLCASAAEASSDDIFVRTLPDGSMQLSNVPAEGGFELLLPAFPAVGSRGAGTGAGLPPAANAAAAGSLTKAGALASGMGQYGSMVALAAQRFNLDARLLHAVIAVESGYQAHAISRKGAIGLMQLMPATARRYGVADARDPSQNILGGAAYLRDLLDLFGNDLQLALAAYNAGEQAVRRYGSRIPPFAETVSYIPKVLAVYRRLEGMSM